MHLFVFYEHVSRLIFSSNLLFSVHCFQDKHSVSSKLIVLVYADSFQDASFQSSVVLLEYHTLMYLIQSPRWFTSSLVLLVPHSLRFLGAAVDLPQNLCPRSLSVRVLGRLDFTERHRQLRGPVFLSLRRNRLYS